MMTIPKDKYNELKPFYDFQRQKEFNKDWCRAVVQKVCNLSDGIIGYDEDSATELLWLHMKEEEYRTPPKNYVPDEFVDEHGAMFTYPPLHKIDGGYAVRLKKR